MKSKKFFMELWTTNFATGKFAYSLTQHELNIQEVPGD